MEKENCNCFCYFRVDPGGISAQMSMESNEEGYNTQFTASTSPVASSSQKEKKGLYGVMPVRSVKNVITHKVTTR